MTTLKGAKQASTAAAMKAERERDQAQALRDYENERRALRANMARLRALRIAKEQAESQATATVRSAKKKAAASAKKNTASQTGSEPQASS